MAQDVTVGFAVVGMGYIGPRHARLIQAQPDARLTAIVEPDAERRAGAAHAFEVPAYSSLEALLAAPEILAETQVVALCTPNDRHTHQAQQVLQAGLHVLIEKPMGLASAACQAVIDQARTAQRQAFVVMQNRYTPTAQWLRRLLAEQRLGRLHFVQVNCFWNRDARYYARSAWKGRRTRDGGVLYTQFSHFLDMLYWLLGPIEAPQARYANLAHQPTTDFEDTGSASFFFRSGAMGNLNFTTAVWDRNQESSLTLIGERGSVKIGGQYMERIAYAHIQDYTPPELPAAEPPNHYGGFTGSAANHLYVIRNVIDTLAGRAAPGTTAEEGQAVVRMIEQLNAAGRKDG
jgi:predicted dehydrogenase